MRAEPPHPDIFSYPCLRTLDKRAQTTNIRTRITFLPAGTTSLEDALVLLDISR